MGGTTGSGGRATERGLAHDLRNLLTAIDGHAQLALAALDADHPAREDVDEVLAATSRAYQLTVAWLAGPTATAPVGPPVPLDELVRGALPLLHAVVGPGIRMELVLDAPARVTITRLRLERVLLNLVLNARAAMEGNGLIVVVTTARPDGRLEVTVTDEGPGIDPDLVARLLAPEGEAEATFGANGHGLGLATSRALLEEAGGALEVSSRPGSGTTMRAVLPRA
ncbi:MAG: ATP-binding protein [Chloroflexota bacterium]